ncbi:hypothetical protein [Deinococcus sedimenti]|nr:hypothetical protein [Deinococcus sedimenti]
MKPIILLAALLASVALADVRVPNTKVSYRLALDPMTDRNASMVFIDAAEDSSGQTYVAFKCDAGTPWFGLYTRTPLSSRVDVEMGSSLPIYYRVDSDPIDSIDTFPRYSDKTGQITISEAFQRDSMAMLYAFLSAKTRVMVRFNHYTGRQITYTFPAAGFGKAFQSIKSCR